MVKAKRPSVFEYHDYRLFLKDSLEFLGNSEKFNSMRAFARAAKISSGHLPLILKGHRKVTPALRKKILKHLDLNDDEQKYFALICIVADAKRTEDRIEALQNIQKIRFYRKQNPRETEVFQYLARWYYVAIREMAMLPDFVADPQWIKNRLTSTVPLTEIKKALDFLTENKFLVKNENGKVVPPEKTIDCIGEVFAIALHKLYQQTFSLALDSMESVEKNKRSIHGRILPVSAQDYERIQGILTNSLKEVSELSKKTENADSVYYVGVTGFPMAESSFNLRQKKGTP